MKKLLPLCAIVLALSLSSCFLFQAEKPISERAGAPLFDDMGNHHMAITTSDNYAQKYFNQGLILDFAFNHAESVRSFKGAQNVDPKCSMCYWGEALALGPNINVTSKGKVVMEDEARIAAFVAIQKAKENMSSATEKERDLINALSTRYDGDPSSDRNVLDSLYVLSMRKLNEKYPQDDDIASLFAESMMNRMPWDYWIDEDNPKPLTQEVIDALETVLARSPNHPLAIHLYIHAVEASSSPGRAEAAADRLANLVPGAGHLVHMPSHIYWRVGRYADASMANEKAAAVDEAYIANCNAQGFYPAAYYPHNIHFLWASSSMEGRSKVAIESARKVKRNVRLEMIDAFPSVEFFHTIPLLALTQFAKWEDVLLEEQPRSDLEFSNAIWHYARATAFANLGKFEDAKEEHEKLKALKGHADIEGLDVLAYPATKLMQIADHLVSGEIAYHDGEVDSSIADYEKAVEIQDGLPYMEPPFWYYPTRQSLGRALLRAGMLEKAEEVYTRDLEVYPRNGWSMYGLIEAKELQGKDATETKTMFGNIWARADTELRSSRL